MPKLITLPEYVDTRGCLTVIENWLPFAIQRVYWMSGFEGHTRGGHRHLKTRQAAICINGSCRIVIVKKGIEENFDLSVKNQCLILEPEDWHSIVDGKNNPILLMLASHHYDPSDYATDPL